MIAVGFALFDTPIGLSGLAWSERGLRTLVLPETTEAATRERLLKRAPGAVEAPPTTDMAKLIEAICAHLAGRPDDLAWAPVDHEGAPELHVRIWEQVRAIPPGETRTYGEVATSVGDRRLAQAVGQAMGRNPTPIVVPCHRVLAAGGKAGGFSAPGGLSTKFRILQIEGAAAPPAAQPGLFDVLPLTPPPIRTPR
ncbi:methylated-DNA--[protein]-cysteine S-methyltransferase [soil metagenome]